MAIYESDITKFMREFLERNPQELEVQRAGRAQWWDKPQDLETERRKAQSSVPVSPYYYQSKD